MRTVPSSRTATAADAPTSGVTLLVGRLTADIGGPYQTLRGYAAALKELRVPVHVLAVDDGPVGPVRLEVPVETVADGRALPTTWRLSRALRRRRSDVLVVVGVWHPAFFAAAVQSWWPGRRLVLLPTMSLMTVDWSRHRFLKTLLRPFVGLTVRARCQVLVAGRGELDASRPTWALGSATVVPHPLVPLRPTDAGPDHTSRQLVYVGRVARQKDLDLLVSALAELPPSWTLLVCGGGTVADPAPERELRARCAALGLGTRVHITGWVDREELPFLVAGSFAAVFTSVDENYCHAAVECMSQGLPVVMVDRISSARDLGALGAVAACPATAADIARTVQELAEDRERWSAMGAAALRTSDERRRTARRAVADAVLGPR